ncbi:MAG: hypothetical protein O2826_02855 [Chloroflexi bacterium]|nr:hypothetical protein [Chloroflexota bacterium]MDA1173440.1 hypothetical protein [Chloroflexota bacterium]
MKTGFHLGLGLIFGVVLFVLTDGPVWIAVGIAIGAGMEQRKRK